ncbi:virginiamycin B lyase family protein [Polaribacter gochangensis]|uniref:virginiamycin B lyase family protein n=1 Tax=Polaribacter gochangensis TaxID=3252903 RepID=UPI0039049642
MKKKYLFLLLVISSFFATLQAQTTRYVTEGGAGTKDGLTWVNASDDIQAMINISAANDQVWVATGSYRPNRRADNISTISSSTDRAVSFLLKKDVKLYGGFAGTETTLAERSLTLSANKTILNGGDINGLGRIFNVIISSGDVGSARLDGFTIFGGTLGNPYLTLQVNGNEISTIDGSGMYNHTSSPTIANCIFYGNFSMNGGGMYNYNSSPTIINSTFYEDTADSDGDEIYNESSSPKIYNSIVWGTIFNNSSTPEIKNSIIKGSNNTTDGNIDAATLTDATLFKDPANGDYSLKAGGIAVNTGSNTLYTNTGGNLTTDVDVLGNKRVFQNTIDIGAYESQKAIITPDANNILYVNKAAIGEGSGNSWANAIPELADALVWANKNKANFTTTPLQIWVAGGTYKPLYSPEDGANFGTNQNKSNAFLMVNNVQIYGGFAGTETTLGERNLSISANKTTLSGDFNNDDTITGSGSTLSITNNTDNTYNIVVSAGDVGSALLDGFTITGGNATFNTKFLANTKEIYICSGAGIYNSESNSTYKNLIIRGNLSAESGGGMFSYMSTPKLENILIESNMANDGGGLTNQGNTNATLTNVTVFGNKSSTNTSGGIYNTGATVVVNNSIIWNLIENEGTGSYIANNSIIKGSSVTTNDNIDATSITETTLFKDPTNGDYSLNPSILNTAINAGDNTLYTGTIATDKDVAGNARLFDGTSTTDVIDLGAYELQQEPIPLAPKTAISLQIYAGVKTVSDLAITGTAIKWYDAATAGNFLENTTVLTDNTTYYASQTVNGVESTDRKAVTTKKISESNQTFLSSANPTVTNLVATPTTNATVKWFTTATNGTALENTATLTTGTYYVEQTSSLLTIETLGSNFSQPFGLTVQSDGKILVADTNNNVIKRMDADGTNIQILGSGFNKPRGVALQSDGKILVADAGNNSIKRMDADGSNIVTLNSTFNQPHGLAVQSDGKILVADSYNSAIKRMDADGFNIVTLGTGFSYPYGITVQSDGKILVADAENSAVKRMDTDGSNMQILGSGFTAPSGVALQSDGKILVAGSGSNPIKRMDADGTNIVTLGSGFNISRGVAVQSDGKILVADTFNNAIKRITEVATSNRIAVAVVIIPSAPTTSYATQVFAGAKTLSDLQVTGTAIKWYDAATAGNFLENTTVLTDNTTYYASQTINGVESTSRIAVTAKKISENNQTFLSSSNPTVANLVATPSTGATAKWFTNATGGTALINTTALATATYYVEQNTPLTIETVGSGFSFPYGVAEQSDGKILVADTSNNAIKRMDADGTNIVTVANGFNKPRGVAVQADGKILVVDTDNHAIKRMDADGSNIVTLSSGFNKPYGVTVQADGKILVADAFNHAIKRMDADGTNIVTLGSGFHIPSGVAVQADGKILVADHGNHAVKRMNADGTNIDILSSGFNYPSSVAVQSDGKILITDTSNNAIKRMDADGTNIVTLGSGFGSPYGVAVQANGKILATDYANSAIKRITEATVSNRVAVSVIIETPAPTTSYATQVFAGASKTLSDLQVTGTAIKWYDAATAGTLLDNTTVLVDNTTYYASQTINSVESTDRLAVTVKKISEASQTFLSNSNPTVANLVATPSTGATAKWFTTATGGTALVNTTTLSTATYYVEQALPSITIETVGNGFDEPRRVAVQADGKILVADTYNNAIKRMDADGTNIVTLASSGFNFPSGIAVQADGKILVADTNNSAIKRMDVDGSNIVTLGSGFNAPYSVAVQADGKILVANAGNSTIKRMDADGTNIVTLGSGFNLPRDVAVQADGKILVADSSNNVIKRMDADGTNIVTLASGFNNPRGVAVQADGKILVADIYNNAIKRMDADGTNIETLASSGFNFPTGVTVQADGIILVADTGNNAIKRITEAIVSNRVAVSVAIETSAPTSTYATQVFAGTKTLSDLQVTGTAIKWYDAATAGTLLDNTTVLIDNTTYYASQTINSVESTDRLAVTVKKISEASQTFLSSSNPTVANLVSMPSTDYSAKWFTTASGGTVLENTTALNSGTYYVEQSRLFNIETIASVFDGPYGVAVQADGKILIADTNNNAIKRMDADGTNIVILGSGFSAPHGVAIQSDGKIVVADYNNSAIKRMDADGKNIETLGSGFSYPRGVAIQSDGKIVVADSNNNVIKRMNSDGSNLEVLGVGGFNFPSGVAIQSDGKIVVADLDNNAIKRMDADGKNIETLGSGFSAPNDVVIQSDGKIVVADLGNNSIKRMDADGKNIETLGSGFSYPSDIAIQSDGKILVADTYNNAIKRITEATISNRVAVSIVVKTTPTITFADFTKTYGDAAFDLAATSTSSATVTYSVVAGGTGEISLSGKNITLVNAGTVTLKASVAENATYEAAEKEITLTINKAELTVTADNKSRVYGESNPTLTFAYSGFKNLEDATALTTVPTASTTASVASNVGTYDVEVANGVATNYSFKYVKGTLEITKKAITITADATTKVYGESDPALTYTASPSLEAGDSFIGNLTRVTGEDANTYAILQGTLSAGTNYTITFVSKDFTITKKAITITADATTKVYGESDPALTYTASPSLETGDSFIGSLTRVTGEDANTYAISQGTLSAGTNYTITFVSKNFTITKASQTITFGEITHSDSDVFDLTATSTSGLAIVYTSSNTNVATISGNTVTVVSAGTTSITATQPGNNNYKAATAVAQTLTVTTLGVEEDAVQLKAVKLYPNPAVNSIRLDIGMVDTAAIQIFDINGKLVIEKKNYQSKEIVNISSLKTGVYLIRVVSTKGNAIKKFIKN